MSEVYADATDQEFSLFRLCSACVLLFLQLSPLVKTKRSSTGKSFPPLSPETKVFVVWVERFDDIGRHTLNSISFFLALSLMLSVSYSTQTL